MLRLVALSLMTSSTGSLSFAGWSAQFKTEGAIKFNNKLGKLPLPFTDSFMFVCFMLRPLHFSSSEAGT